MSNLRFPKVFVLDPVSTKLISATDKKPTDLTAGQVGFFERDQFGVTVGGTGAAPSPNDVRQLFIGQNVGDSKYGTVKTQTIEVTKVRAWYGEAAMASQKQVTYIGWDESDNAKNIAASCGKELLIPILIYQKKLARWYAPVGFKKVLIIDTSCCPDCGDPCSAADKEAIADMIVTQINTGLQRDGDFLAGNELGQLLTATKVENGLTGADYRVGVKVETKAVDEDDSAALNSCDPTKYWEYQQYSFTIGTEFNGICSGTQLVVTTTQYSHPGRGWAAGVAALEAESQGYDRVRSPHTEYPWSKQNGYKIYAAAGKKYDYYFLQYQYAHRLPGGITSTIEEPYEAILICPTTEGANIEALLNAWLVNKFDAVSLDDGS